MTEVEFRVKHSELIEYYQLIEMHLKGICAALDVDKENSWFDKLDDFEADPLGKLLKEIKKLQSKKIINCLKMTILENLMNCEKNAIIGFISAFQQMTM